MNNSFANVTVTLAEHLLTLVDQDAVLKQHLRRLAEIFLEQTQERTPPFPVDSPSVSNCAGPSEFAAIGAEIAEPVSGQEEQELLPRPVLTLGQPKPLETIRSAPQKSEDTDDDLKSIEIRCRLKVEGARWALSRRLLLNGGADFETQIDPQDRDLIARAKQTPNCFLWMCHPNGPVPAQLDSYRQLANCYEAVAEGVLLIITIQSQPEEEQEDFEASLDLLAEAQSSLRKSLLNFDGYTDHDQVCVYEWVRRTAASRQIFIAKHMRIDQPANPDKCEDLIRRIQDVAHGVEVARRQRHQRKRLLGKVKHKVSRI